MNLIILTSGLESDVVAKKIGDAVTKEQRWTTENDDQSTAKARIKCVGITTWGALKEKEKPKFLKRVYNVIQLLTLMRLMLMSSLSSTEKPSTVISKVIFTLYYRLF